MTPLQHAGLILMGVGLVVLLMILYVKVDDGSNDHGHDYDQPPR